MNLINMLFNLINFLLLVFIVVAPLVYFLLILYELRKHILAGKWVIACFVGFVLLYFNKLLFKGQTLAQQDFNNIQITFFKFFQESALTHKLPPIWNSYTGGGYDAFSNPLANYFSPFLAVFLVFKDVFYAANVFLVLQTFFTLAFAYIFFRVLKLNKGAAFLGAVMWVFNAFFAMRLSPGVGVEYFFTLKWITLALTFTHLYFESKKTKHLLFLAISLAFMFEGNMNMAIVGGGMWLIYTLFVFRKQTHKLISAPIIGFLIYAVRLIPGLFLIATAQGRISETVEGWRVERILISNFLEYFLPIKQLFQTPLFTPGLFGIIFCIAGVIFLLIRFKHLDTLKPLVLVSLLFLILGAVFSTANPISDLMFSLPFFNRLTILPAFIVFVLFAVVMLSALAANEFIKTYIYGAFVGFLPFIFFAEILIGPPTLLSKTYAFNFLKMNYKQEMRKLEYYNFMQDSPKVAIFLDDRRLFTLPSYNAYLNVYTLNDFKYLYGSTVINDFAKRTNLAEISKYADVFIAAREMRRGTKKLDEIKIPRFDDENFDNYAVIDRAFNYDELQLFRWDYTLKLYEPLERTTTSVKKNTSHPTSHTFIVQKQNIEQNGSVITSITYSPFWRTNNNSEIVKGRYGYLNLTNAKVGDKIVLKYVNPYIYLGFALSLGTFVIVVYQLWKHKREV